MQGRPQSPSGLAHYLRSPVAVMRLGRLRRSRPGQPGLRPASPGKQAARGGTRGSVVLFSEHDRQNLGKKTAKILPNTFAVLTREGNREKIAEPATPCKDQYVVQASPLPTGTN